jgi:GntR family transcriptional regulator, transcriptional repressor for pyruvate dehydrogenase complex
MPRTKQEIPDTHRTVQVVNHIRALIENGSLKPGDKIPPERDLARSLNMSRASLRTGIGDGGDEGAARGRSLCG